MFCWDTTDQMVIDLPLTASFLCPLFHDNYMIKQYYIAALLSYLQCIPLAGSSLTSSPFLSSEIFSFCPFPLPIYNVPLYSCTAPPSPFSAWVVYCSTLPSHDMDGLLHYLRLSIQPFCVLSYSLASFLRIKLLLTAVFVRYNFLSCPPTPLSSSSTIAVFTSSLPP